MGLGFHSFSLERTLELRRAVYRVAFRSLFGASGYVVLAPATYAECIYRPFTGVVLLTIIHVEGGSQSGC